MRVQPAPDLRGCHRERGDGTHIGGVLVVGDDDAERDIQRELAEDLQRWPEREAVQRRQHRALDRVLDRHARVVGLAGAHGVQRGQVYWTVSISSVVPRAACR